MDLPPQHPEHLLHSAGIALDVDQDVCLLARFARFVQLHVEHVDSEFLEDLQGPRQTANLVLERENDGRLVGPRTGTVPIAAVDLFAFLQVGKSVRVIKC